VINPSVYGKVKSDFFAKGFYLEPTGTISRIQIIMPSSQVPFGAKDIHFRNRNAGHPHKIVASSNDILCFRPDRIPNIFPILLFPRSGCTKEVLN